MESISPDIEDRLAMRQSPMGMPVMLQTWTDTLFIHWSVNPHLLRPLIPRPLTLDTYEGRGWIGITPFRVQNARAKRFPPVPWLNDFNEVNVRTYVHMNGEPGVWFFSLDADSGLAVTVARALVQLPYFYANIQLDGQEDEGTWHWHASRESAEPQVRFHATCTVGPQLPVAEPGSLDFFLLERYALYATSGHTLQRVRVFHPPWPLRQATLASYSSTLLEADRLPVPGGDPIVHWSPGVDVGFWPLEGSPNLSLQPA